MRYHHWNFFCQKKNIFNQNIVIAGIFKTGESLKINSYMKHILTSINSYMKHILTSINSMKYISTGINSCLKHVSTAIFTLRKLSFSKCGEMFQCTRIAIKLTRSNATFWKDESGSQFIWASASYAYGYASYSRPIFRPIHFGPNCFRPIHFV